MSITRSARLRLYAIAAFALAAIALSPPMDARADASFAWHMAQHLVLLFAVPLLLLLAHPLEWFGSPRAGWRIAAIRAIRSAPVRTLCSPPSALAIFLVVLWGTHFTPLYELALEHPAIHIAEHALYLFAGTLFWLPIVAPPPFPAPPHAVRVFYCFLALPQGALLAIALLSARTPLYAQYAGPGALADQHDAAAVMWVAGGGIVFVAFLVTIARWAARERYALVALAAGLSLLAWNLRAPASAASTQTPPFTADQARVGQTLFYENCAECHGASLQGHYGPALAGPDGNLQWVSVQFAFQYMTAHMPAGNADGLTSAQYVALMAYILSRHHHAPSATPLTAKAANSSLALLGQ